MWPADLTQLAKKNGGTFPFWQALSNHRWAQEEIRRARLARNAVCGGDRFAGPKPAAMIAAARAQAGMGGCSAWCFICSIFKNRSVCTHCREALELLSAWWLAITALNGCGSLDVDTQFFEFSVKRRKAQSHELGGAHLIAGGFIQGALDVALLI